MKYGTINFFTRNKQQTYSKIGNAAEFLAKLLCA